MYLFEGWNQQGLSALMARRVLHRHDFDLRFSSGFELKYNRDFGESRGPFEPIGRHRAKLRPDFSSVLAVRLVHYELRDRLRWRTDSGFVAFQIDCRVLSAKQS